MSVEMNIVYEGKLHCKATHEESGAIITTDAPMDNNGKSEAFSPTDLVAAALGTCTLTIMGMMAERADIDLTGTEIHIVKEMGSKPKRHISSVTLNISFPKGLTLPDNMKSKLEKAYDTCPVKNSLGPDTQVTVNYNYS